MFVLLQIAKTLLHRYLINHNWLDSSQPISLSLVIRTMIQMTMDITNISTLLENNNSETVFDIIQSFFSILHVE